ncbi:MAG: hypothetical protein B7Y02_15995 [Rhodobacterales bacterium 17-64-5]|nr:MAG: hypothetical protein B7Y02_15995 [Rhodobacterales bacterium 17-64-5]
MPHLIRLYITNVVLGFALAAAFVGALVMLDVAGLRHLVLQSDMGIVAALMLWVFHGVVFAGVQFAIAVMALAEDDTPRGGKLIPIRIEATARSKRR